MSQQLLHEHYIGAVQSFEIVNPGEPHADARPDVTILKTFYIDDTINLNDWRAEWEGLKLDAADIIGIPLVLQEDLQHPKFSVQKYYDRGTIFAYDIDEENHRIIVYVRITDPEIAERIKSGELQYVSPAVIPRGSEYVVTKNGVDTLTRTVPIHLCIVGEPAYEKHKALMTHICTGDGKECYHRLKTMEFKAAANIINLDSHTMRKMNASLARMASVIEQQNYNMEYPIHGEKEGAWINAKGVDVFVARDQSIQEAIDSQCGCNNKN